MPHKAEGALCSACRKARPLAELLKVTPATPGARVFYVCRPSLSDMRLPLCTSRAVMSRDTHVLELADPPEWLHAA